METSHERGTNSAQQRPTQGARLEEVAGAGKGVLMARGHDYEPASAQSDPAFLEQITINYIRHNLTVYETHLKEVAGQSGISEAERVVRRRVYDEIAAQRPDYAEECKRQMRDCSGEAQNATG
jgi:hypothetical protein